MRKLIMIAGIAAAVAAPTLSFAQSTHCERARSERRTVGTVAGGLLGALAGSAIASRHDSGAGVLIGGVAGAVAGNQLAKGSPCPAGYVRSYYAPRRSSPTRTVVSARTAPYSTPYGPRCGWQDQAYRDSYGSVLHRQVQVCR